MQASRIYPLHHISLRFDFLQESVILPSGSLEFLLRFAFLNNRRLLLHVTMYLRRREINFLFLIYCQKRMDRFARNFCSIYILVTVQLDVFVLRSNSNELVTSSASSTSVFLQSHATSAIWQAKTEAFLDARTGDT